MVGQNIKIIGALALLGAVAITLLVIESFPSSTTGFSPQPAPVSPSIFLQKVHNSAWYLAHRGALKIDEQRCAGDAATISKAECQNVANAASLVDHENVEQMLRSAIKSNK